MNKAILKTLALSVALIGINQPAQAVLGLVGPVDATNGFPRWYMDNNGLPLELCVNNNATVLAAGGCVILPPDVTVVPEVLTNDPATTNWFAEHFYSLANAKLTSAGIDKVTGQPAAGVGKITFGLAVEAAFSTGAPVPGAQITFNRWRVFHTNLPCTGDYTYYTPFNTGITFTGAAGDRIFETSDIGVGAFTGALAGTTGPFLRWAATPGAATPKAFFVGPDGRYVSDYNLAAGTPMTGSTIDNPFLNSTLTHIPASVKTMPKLNYFMVEGNGVATGNCSAKEAVVNVDAISLYGRVFEGPIPTPNKVDRATYSVVSPAGSNAAPTTYRVTAYATAQQKPGSTVVPTITMNLLSGDPAAPTVGANVTAKSFQFPGITPNKYQFSASTTAARVTTGTLDAQARPAAFAARLTINDTPATVLTVPLVDEVNITEAMWDANLKTLTVVAESGAALAAPTAGTTCSTPCLTLDNLGLPAADAANVAIDYRMKSTAGSNYAVMSTVIPNVQFPPESISVLSSGGGRDTRQVMYSGVPTGSAMAVADSASTPVSVAITIPVLANDVGLNATPALQICTAATGGTCGVPPAAGTALVTCTATSCTSTGAHVQITADNQLVYTPNGAAGGLTDTFWYQVNSASGLLRAPVVVTVVGPVAPPDAFDDTGLAAVVNVSTAFDVLANDFAPAGVDLTKVVITKFDGTGAPVACALNGSACAPASFDAQGRLVFKPSNTGTWFTTYTFTDKAGLVADGATVTVNVVGAETLTMGKTQYLAPKKAGQSGSLIVDGTTTALAAHVLELRLPNATTGTQGCSNPTAGTKLASTLSTTTGSFAFGSTAVASNPGTAFVYSPSSGACKQFTLVIK